MPPKDRDPFETTRPPDGYRCDAHETFVREMGQTSEQIKTLFKQQEKFEVTVKDGFAAVNSSIREYIDKRDSDVRGLSTRMDKQDKTIASLSTVQAEGKGGVKLLVWLIPLLVTITAAGVGILFSYLRG